MNIYDNLLTVGGTCHQKNSRNNHETVHSSLMNHRFIKVSALSLMCLAALPSFAQPLNCSGGYWNGEAWVCPQNIPGGGNPWGSPNQNGNGHNPGGHNSGGGCWIGDPGCHSDSDGEDHSEPEPGPSNEDILACNQHMQMKPSGCLFDPIGKNEYNWNGFGERFKNLFDLFNNGLPSGGFPNLGAPLTVYRNIIRDVAHAYWDEQTLTAVNEAYWEAVSVYCVGFPPTSVFGADQSDCYEQAYEVSLRLVPSLSSHAFTVSQVEGWGVTLQHLSSNNPFANWAYQFFLDIDKVKQCKVWFDGKDAINGCY